jgi:hypothetical protein
MDIPFTVQRLGFEHNFRLEEQIDDAIDRLVLSISNLIELIRMGEIDQQVGDVRGDLGIGPAKVFREALFG